MRRRINFHVMPAFATSLLYHNFTRILNIASTTSESFQLMSLRQFLSSSGGKGTSSGGYVGRTRILNGKTKSTSSNSSAAAGTRKQSSTVMQHHQPQPPLAPLPPSSQSHLEQFSVAHHPHAAAAVAAMQASPHVLIEVPELNFPQGRKI